MTEIFAITAPGLESVAAAELKTLGIGGRVVAGGVEWSGRAEDVYRACLHLRTASRVVVRAARFRARSFIELERHVKRIDWSPYLRAEIPLTLRVSSSKSRLYHERAIAERFAGHLAAEGYRVLRGRDPDNDGISGAGIPGTSKLRRRQGTKTEPAESSGNRSVGPAEEEGNEPSLGDRAPDDALLIVVRVHRDECIVSVDAAGALLHRRGYRQAVARAPLRETIAAAMLLTCGWKIGDPLLDPLCGSGTIPIEAALISREIAPGLATADRLPRAYAFERWPAFDRHVWEGIVRQAQARIRDEPASPIAGSDRDVGATEAAIANAGRAGVAEDLRFRVAAVSEMDCPGDSGWIVTNPPYGIRVGESGPLRNLYAALGRTVGTRCRGWSLAMLSADPRLAEAAGVQWDQALRTSNGGVPVSLLVGRP